jgi:hypothetical protein
VRWQDGPFRIWELPVRASAVAVHADYNRVQADIEVGSRPVVLPYHWVDGLKTGDENEIVPVFQGDDPVAYICVRRVVSSPVRIRY